MKKKLFDIYEFLEKRPLSWSAISAFSDPDYGNPEKWYQGYVLGIKDPPSKEMIFGSMVDRRIQTDLEFLPELERYPIMQHKMQPVYEGIPLIGLADHWSPFEKRLADDKTGRVAWTKKKADETGQLTLYAAMLYLEEGIKPEEIEFAIRWLPTVLTDNGMVQFADPFEIQHFKSTRSMVDILKMLGKVKKTVKEMEDYANKRMAGNDKKW